ncbi:MAG: hypothetical protein UX74_C0012G0007 [Parcubacteria group bacterium GW2011_GWA2_47_10b]|nr:MAG: hypothetical protein UX74_C0012G0007 [Parcubacteria group bacterium GW2011_GWA2_47_10b]
MSPSLISHVDVIWKTTVAFLIVFFVAVLLFDGYIFLFRVQELDEERIDIGNEAEIVGIKKGAFQEAKENLKMRSQNFSTATTSVPRRNPFEQTVRKP